MADRDTIIDREYQVMTEKASILLFVKTPGEGRLKSRLSSIIGKEKAGALYTNFILDTVDFIETRNYPLKVFFHPQGSEHKLKELIGGKFEFIPQTGNDLGERMKNAFVHAFSKGDDKALLIGSDIPDLERSIIDEAFESLDTFEAAIGPAFDGGYYLIGFTKDTFLSDVFESVSWSSDSVFGKTMDIFAKKGRNVHILPEWRDVDTIDDLKALVERNMDSPFRGSRTMSYVTKNKILDLK